MATIDQAPLGLRLFLRTYRWRRINPVPWAPLRKPLRECRVALISSAGFTLPDQLPFDPSVKGGDVSLRLIPSSADVRSLFNTHRSESFDPTGIESDPNIALPLDRMRELADEGTIGQVSPRAVSVMGSITTPGRFIRDTAPAIARALREDEVDAALLVPL